jgi:hypothetical protein
MRTLRRNARTLALSALALLAACGDAALPFDAQPSAARTPAGIQSVVAQGANGHFYTLVHEPTSYGGAARTAGKMTYAGRPGHLATISSPEEMATVAELAGTPGRYWLGASRDANVAGGMSWVTGEPFSYDNWASPGEALFVDNTPLGAQMIASPGAAIHGMWVSEWVNSRTATGFIVEFDA